MNIDCIACLAQLHEDADCLKIGDGEPIKIKNATNRGGKGRMAKGVRGGLNSHLPVFLPRLSGNLALSAFEQSPGSCTDMRKNALKSASSSIRA